MFRWLAVPLTMLVISVACSSSHRASESATSATPSIVSSSPAADLEETIDFETDEPAPSVSVLRNHQIVVVVRVINHDDAPHSFIARATLHDQQGDTIATGTTPVALDANDGRLIRIEATNPRDRQVWSVQFDALPR